jgi:hypothetical protein
LTRVFEWRGLDRNSKGFLGWPKWVSISVSLRTNPADSLLRGRLPGAVVAMGTPVLSFGRPRTYCCGKLSGDHPVNRIDEIWKAPDLSMFVKMFLDDGFGFTELSELRNIDRSEPEHSVFLPPADLPRREAPESDPVWSEPYGG